NGKINRNCSTARSTETAQRQDQQQILIDKINHGNNVSAKPAATIQLQYQRQICNGNVYENHQLKYQRRAMSLRGRRTEWTNEPFNGGRKPVVSYAPYTKRCLP
ncbi:MAG: hypothetical protein ABJZ69_09970, partial [Hyphomicrobiales bacterium]